MKKFFNEFKVFISKGNVFDIAVGLIIATAFNKIVSSLVNDIIMPLITFLTGANQLSDLSIVLRQSSDGTVLTWNYGNFIQSIIDFIIIAFSVFIMVKIVNNSRKKLKDFSTQIITEISKKTRDEKKLIKKQAKQEKRPFKQVWEEYQKQKESELVTKLKEKEQEEKKQKELDKVNNPTQEDLLKEIRDLLKTKFN